MRKAVAGVREAAGRGAQIVCLQELFRSQYFCQIEDHGFFDLAEPIPGPSTEALGRAGRRARRRDRRLPLREARRGPLPQHRRHHRCRRHVPGQVPEDAHPGRPAVLREVLLHPRRPRLPELGHPLRPDRRAGLLGPVVPRGRPADRHERRPDPLLPHRHRLAPGGEGRARRAAAGGVGDHPAEPRHRQRRLRLRREPGRPRGRPGRRASSSGAAASCPTRAAGSWSRAAPARRSSSPGATWARWTRAAPTGPSCATAASTPTRTSPSGTSIERPSLPRRRPLGYRMPAEWEPHRGTWLSWPHKEAPGRASSARCRASSPRWCATRRPRGGAHQRGRAGHGADVRRLLADAGADSGNVFFHHNPHQRRLVPRSRPHLPPARRDGARPPPGDRRLELQRLGRQVPALRSRRRDPDPHRRRSSGCRCFIPAS